MADWLDAMRNMGRAEPKAIVKPVRKTKDAYRPEATPTALAIPPGLDSPYRCRAIVSLLAQDVPFRACLENREGASDYCAHHNKNPRRQHFLRAVLPADWMERQQEAFAHAPPAREKQVRKMLKKKIEYIQDGGHLQNQKVPDLSDCEVPAPTKAEKPKWRSVGKVAKTFKYDRKLLPVAKGLSAFYGEGGERAFVVKVREIIKEAPPRPTKGLKRIRPNLRTTGKGLS